MTTTTKDTGKESGRMPVRVIIAASVGSALEWYDFVQLRP